MKNCVVYLVRASEDDLLNLNKSLALADDNLLAFTPADVILFIEEEFEPYIPRVIGLKNSEITYVVIKFPPPPEGTVEIFPHPLPEQIAKGNMGFSIGYRQMCNFFAGAMFDQPILENYKYILRLDTDSYILSPVNYDIFDMMLKGNYKYGTIKEAMQLDHEKVVEGLWNFCWPGTHNIPEREIFYTNFEIMDAHWFRTDLYYLFYKRIEATGNIFHKRWGDAPIRRLGVGILMPEHQVFYVKGFIYQHGAIYDLR